MAKFQDVQAPYSTYAESTAPGTPASGLLLVYAKADGKLYAKNDAGVEVDLTASGGGGGGSITTAKVNGSNAGDISTTAGTWVDVTGMSTSLAAVAGNTLEFVFTASAYCSPTVANLDFRFAVNGVAVGPIWRLKPSDNVFVKPLTMVYHHTVASGDLSAGSAPVKVQWMSTTGFVANASGIYPQLAVKNIG